LARLFTVNEEDLGSSPRGTANSKENKMGHSVSKAADNAVKKSEAVKVKAARTDEQIIRDIEINLNAGLSVPPNDVRLLLKKYKESRVLVDQIVNQAAEDLGKAVAKDLIESEVAAQENMTSEGGLNGN
jgi:hypothetical protein